MTNQEKAIIVISGKMLERPFSLDVLDELRAGIERVLSDQEIVVVRRAATLSPERFIAAPYFLQAGFEVVPADDEDVQASAIIMESAMGAAPSSADVAVFALGDPEPVQLLRFLGGKTRRALISDGELSEDVAANLESAFDIRGVLTKEGIDLAKVHFLPWDEWSATVLDARLGEASESTSPTEESQAAVASPSVEELCETQDASETELFERSAPKWNDALERLVLQKGGKFAAYPAVQILAEERFRGLDEFYLKYRDDFVSLLGEGVKYIPQDGENSTSFFYHRSHEAMQPVSIESALKQINIGSDSRREENAASADRNRAETTVETNFEEIAETARVMAAQCRWSVERKTLSDAYAREREDRDNELSVLASPYGLTFWQRQAEEKYGFTDERFLTVAKLYDHLERVFRFVGKCMRDRESIPAKLAKPILQLAANAQCLLKSAFNEYNVPMNADPVQRNAFNYLSDFRKRYYSNIHLDNMRLEVFLSLGSVDKENAALEKVSLEYDRTVNRVRKIEEYCGKIRYHVGRIKERPDGEFVSQDWAKVVDVTTILCRDFAEPYSSIRLRDLLYSIVDDVPEYVETTEEFARVVQEIELFKENEEKTFEWAKATPSEETDDSNPEILAVRKRYGNAKVVFIGGTPQPHLTERLQKKLQIELIWFETDHGDSLDRFNRYLNDEEVKLFLVYIPWCSHKHSLEFSRIARDAGKDFVRVTKGTSAASIARHVCDQVNLSVEDVPAPEIVAQETEDVVERETNVDAA